MENALVDIEDVHDSMCVSPSRFPVVFGVSVGGRESILGGAPQTVFASQPRLPHHFVTTECSNDS